MGPNLGLHVIEDVPISDVIGFLKFLFAGQLLYVISLATIKFTILAFYWRLFSVALRIPILIALFIVTAWALSVVRFGTVSSNAYNVYNCLGLPTANRGFVIQR